MADDLEDGEVLELDDEDEKSTSTVSAVTNVTPATAQNTSNNSVWNSGSYANGAVANYNFSNGASHLKFVPKPLRNSDSESDDDSTSETDSPSRPKRATPSEMLTKLSVFSAPSPTIPPPPDDRRTKTKKKGGDLWTSVMCDQDLSKGMSGWFGMSSKVDSDRDVETYDYRKAKNDPRPAADDDDMDAGDVATEEFGTESAATDNICDREIFGTAFVRVKKDPKTKPTEGEQTDDAETGERHSAERKIWRKRPHPNAVPAHGRLGTRGFDEEKDRSHIRASVADEPEVVAVEIIRILKEPDTMMPTFLKVVEVGGAQKALETLYCTEDLEEAGGLMIQNGSRRRTPGGVYLYLIKEDTTLTKEQQDEIFRDSREEWKRQQRLKRAERRQFLANTTVDPRPTSGQVPVPDGNTASDPVDGGVAVPASINNPGPSHMEDTDLLEDDIPDITIS